MIEIKQEMFNFWSIILQFLIAAGAIVFGIWQIKINLRLKKIQESVALSIVPGIGLNLQLMNVGGINLYLKKYEIESKTENFEKPLLIAAGAGNNSFLQITVPNFERNKKHDIKLYLIDEFKEKYLSSGELIIEDIEIMSPAITPQESATAGGTFGQVLSMTKIKTLIIKAWSYKTVKRSWEI